MRNYIHVSIVDVLDTLSKNEAVEDSKTNGIIESNVEYGYIVYHTLVERGEGEAEYILTNKDEVGYGTICSKMSRDCMLVTGKNQVVFPVNNVTMNAMSTKQNYNIFRPLIDSVMVDLEDIGFVAEKELPGFGLVPPVGKAIEYGLVGVSYIHMSASISLEKIEKIYTALTNPLNNTMGELNIVLHDGNGYIFNIETRKLVQFS